MNRALGASPRPVYRHAELERLFNPRSVAVFGASPNPQSFGARTIANLGRYQGRILRINPRYQKIDDAPCYPTIAATPEPPDCALLSVPREAIEAALLECATRGVGGAVIFASGYAETGHADHARQQERLTAIARDTGIKILGPNCLGFVNFATGAMMSFASAEMQVDPPRSRGIGIVSQSGALGFALGQAERRGMALSHVLTFGNGADVNVADEIAFLAEDSACAAIACLFEGMPHPTQLLAAGEIAWRAEKPVVICKLGRGNQGSTAALSHTGSLTGSTQAYMALFERAGFVIVDAIEDLLETASFFAKVGRPRSRGVAAIGASGGALIAAADAAEAFGVGMPQPPEDMARKLRAYVPEFGALRNPCDLTAMMTKDNRIAVEAVGTMLDGDTYGAIVVPLTSLSRGSVARVEGMGEAGRRMGKPVCLTYASGWIGGPSTLEAEMHSHLQSFQSIDRCFATLAAWHRRDDRMLAEQIHGPRNATRVSPERAADEAAKLIATARGHRLTEREAKSVLAAYGVPVVQENLAQSAASAVEAARVLGFPVALKVESPDIPHKSEAGVIRLNLKTSDEVREAFDAVMASAQRFAPRADLRGALVQPMVPAGIEVMVGARIDPQFGPLIVAGMGGVLVELLQDSATELAPVTAREAHAMLDKLRGKALFDGFRGSEAVNLDVLVDVIVRISELASDQRECIHELDVNPLVCSRSEVTAVDALIVRS
jgi:acetate---CoA ligase (ADP-forming)